MKICRILWITVLCSMFASCFKEEPLNAECDILEVSVKEGNLTNIFFNDIDNRIKVLSSDSIINFQVRLKADLSAVAPSFKITNGSTIYPYNHSKHDFSKGPVVYTVTSEDGEWSRRYYVNFVRTTQTVKDTIHYDFEHYKLEPNDKKFYLWYELNEKGDTINPWANGNVAFSLAAGNLSADKYPTAPMKKKDNNNSFIKLTTCSTGALGSLFGKPIAAGNMFLGTFDAGISLINPNKATKFGIPFTQKPIKLRGWYKYNPGKEFKNKKQEILKNRTDQGAIYAVFYRNTIVDKDGKTEKIELTGEDILTSKQIVGIAQMENVKTTPQWTAFEIPFSYLKGIDNDVLTKRGYSLAIVFSSSKDGALFEGAIGSELCIDDIEIICTQEKE